MDHYDINEEHKGEDQQGGWGLRTNPGCHVYLPSGITLPSELETQAGALGTSPATDHLERQIIPS